MMWSSNMKGILIPNLRLPFYTHHKRYKDKNANTPVARKPALPFSSPIRILLKNELTGCPLTLTTIDTKLI